jgi:thioredoxin reductase
LELPSVTIVGGGPAGVAAAVWACRLGFPATLLEVGERLGGMLWAWTEPVTDLPGWRGTPAALAAAYEEQVAALGVQVALGCRAVALRPGVLVTSRGEWPYERLVIATGTRRRRPGFPGADLLPAAEPPLEGRRVAVLGGGDGAAFVANRLLAERASVTIVHRGRPRMQPRFLAELRQAGAAFRSGEVVAAEPDAGRWRLHLRRGGDVLVDAAVARLGYEPAAEWTGLPLADGYIRADTWGRTALPGVYTVGDVSRRTPPSRSSLANAYAQAMYALKDLSLHPGEGAG